MISHILTYPRYKKSPSPSFHTCNRAQDTTNLASSHWKVPNLFEHLTKDLSTNTWESTWDGDMGKHWTGRLSVTYTARSRPYFTWLAPACPWVSTTAITAFRKPSWLRCSLPWHPQEQPSSKLLGSVKLLYTLRKPELRAEMEYSTRHARAAVEHPTVLHVCSPVPRTTPHTHHHRPWIQHHGNLSP